MPELFHEPIGSLVAGRSVIVWVQTPSRFGAVHRSPLDVADAPTLAMLAPLPLHPSLVPPFDMLQLREALARDLQEATIERIAGEISISDRSLQRQLSAHGTSFSDALARARIRAAEAMLFDGSEKIETIALMVGFRSAAAFTTMFRRVNGEAPGEFRNRALARRAKAS